ncbi:hypothetical protein [Sorangium sp. So ce1099]|uniref:hypothetical protein n=1 Tax=Sorangium sp. So ce1099 TaxID=3133331 RepID=UPI003F63D892
MKMRQAFAVFGVVAAVGIAGCVGSEEPAEPEIVRLDPSEAAENPLGSWSGPASGPAAEAQSTGETSDAAAYCWVWLDYCVDPRTGTGTCHDNGGCSWDQFINACISLYEDICI